jgi:hypothetical protein
MDLTLERQNGYSPESFAYFIRSVTFAAIPAVSHATGVEPWSAKALQV